MHTSITVNAVAIGLLSVLGQAHPGHTDPLRTPDQLHRSAKRIQSGYKCNGAAEASLHRRMAKRGLALDDANRLRKRWEPTYDKIQNQTCVLAPEVMEGPFWISDIMMRQNLTDGEPGLPILLDIGVLDVNTCEPLANVGIDLWTVNATGHYSGFSSNEGGGGGGGPGGPRRGPHGPGGPPGRGPPGRGPPGEEHGQYDIFADAIEASTPTSCDSAPSSTSTKKPNGGMKEPDLDERFLRGFWPTNAHGVAELAMNFPGWYSGRNPHIHLKVHTNWNLETHDDGQKYIDGGQVAHTGQIFFEDSLADLVYKWGVYAERPGSENRKRNGDDHTFEEAAQDGFDPTVRVTWVDENDIGKGLIGYLTVGVDGEAAGKVAEEAGLFIQA